MAATTPNTRPQCTSVPGMVPIMLAAPISRVDGLLRLAGLAHKASARGGMVGGGGIAHNALDQMVEDGERDVDQQQARNRFIDAAVLTKPAGEHDPQPAADHAG